MMSHHVTCHVTAVSHASSSSKRKIKEKRKENQYKIRKIEEKKNKIVSVQAFHNMLSMISHVTRIDQNIIKIDYHTNIEEKNVIHKVLEDNRSISKTKRHNKLFEKFIADAECGLSFVNADIASFSHTTILHGSA